MKPRKLWWATVFAIFVSFVLFAARPTALSQLLSMASVPIVLSLLVAAFWRAAFGWRQHGPKVLLPVLVLIVTLPAGVLLGRLVRSLVFSHQLPQYEAAAQWASSRAVAGQAVTLRPPEAYKHLASTVHVLKDSDCGLRIDFFWGSGFPVKHIVRRYAPLDTFVSTPHCRDGWSSGRELAESWYELSD